MAFALPWRGVSPTLILDPREISRLLLLFRLGFLPRFFSPGSMDRQNPFKSSDRIRRGFVLFNGDRLRRLIINDDRTRRRRLGDRRRRWAASDRRFQRSVIGRFPRFVGDPQMGTNALFFRIATPRIRMTRRLDAILLLQAALIRKATRRLTPKLDGWCPRRITTNNFGGTWKRILICRS